MNKDELVERFQNDLLELTAPEGTKFINKMIDLGWHIDEPNKPLKYDLNKVVPCPAVLGQKIKEDNVKFKEGDIVSIKNYPKFRVYHIRNGKYTLEMFQEKEGGYDASDLELVEPAEEVLTREPQIGDVWKNDYTNYFIIGINSLKEFYILDLNKLNSWTLCTENAFKNIYKNKSKYIGNFLNKSIAEICAELERKQEGK